MLVDMKTFLIVLVAVFSLSVFAEKADEAEVRKLLKTTNAEKMAQQVLDSIVAMFSQQAKGATEEFWKEFRKGVNTSELIDRLVPVYQELFTDSDIKALNEFYGTEAGKKFISVQGQLMQKSMTIGQQWGGELAQKAMNSLTEKGLIQPPGQEKPAKGKAKGKSPKGVKSN